MRLLFVGDVVGQAGRTHLRRGLRRIRAEHAPDLIVVNGENSAGGHGITPSTADEIFEAGADVITTGNHVWDRREIEPYLDTRDRIVRPANLPDSAPGSGMCVVTAADGTVTAVANLMGRVFMPPCDEPFRAADELLKRLEGRARVILVDFHAEATSEKVALGRYLDGRVSAVIGTHTHIATADEAILPGGTAYQTDTGMTGPHDSVIGMEKSRVIERFVTQRPVRFSPATGDVRLNGVLIEISPEDGKARSIRRIDVRENEREASP